MKLEISHRPQGLQYFKCLHVKSGKRLAFIVSRGKFEHELEWDLDSSIGKSARLVMWRSELRIPVQVQIFLLKSKKENSCL